MTKAIEVRLGERTYAVFIGDEELSRLGERTVDAGLPASAVIITDSNVAGLYLLTTRRALEAAGVRSVTVVTPAGESQKSLRRFNAILTEMLRKGVGRDWFVVALGGGVIGDLAGFVAATYMRGLPYVQVPTTLLAQVDSSVGGKVGIDHRLGKNLVGAFHQPRLVCADVRSLSTLPAREVVSGLGEVVKYGLIEEGLLELVEENVDALLAVSPEKMLEVAQRCVRTKAEIIEADERESGRRMVLNLGHTIAHGLEAATRYSKLRHGEAVLAGIAAETWIAVNRGTAESALLDRVTLLLGKLPLTIDLAHLRMRDILKPLRLDKKNRGGNVRFALPRKIGEVVIVDDVSEQEIISSIEFLRTLFR